MSLDAFLLLLAALLSLLFINKIRSRSRRNLPPGPTHWPLLGNVFNKTQTIHSTMSELEAKYGPIFTLRRGPRPLIVVTSAELIRETLVEKGHIFCTRPPAAGPPTIGSTAQGALWRALRKNMATQTLHPTRLTALRGFRHKAIEALLDRLTTEAAQNGGAVTVADNIRVTVFGILLYMCFGFEMDIDYVQEFQSIMADVLHKAKILSMDYHAFPFQTFFQPGKVKERNQILSRAAGLVVSLVQKRRRMLSEGSASANGHTAYVDTLFDLELSDEAVVGLCSEFVHAGSHTTSVTLQFLLANLITHPHVQSKLYEDIVGVVGKRAAEVEDVEKMEYVEAVVMETLRRHVPGYFTLPYAPTQDCTLGGWHVPVGAVVNLYMEGMTRDPRLWEKPWDFVPERFLNAPVDVTGTKDMKMIPFSTGRRICPGLGLAMIHLRLILVRLVQAFQWQCIPGQPLDLSEMDGFVEVMAAPVRSLRKPFKALAIPRQ